MNLKQVNVLLLGLAFHLIFFSFQTSVFVQQTVVNSLISRPNNKFHGNAYLSLCITYSVFALSNWLAPSIIALTGIKYGMIFGSITYVLYSASFLYPTTWLFYISAALIGFGAAPLWTAQGAFLAKQSDQRTSSKNAAIFWSMLQSSLLLGNLFVYFAFSHSVQKQGETITSYNNLTVYENVTYLANVDGDEQNGKISDKTRYILYGVLTIVCSLGTMVLLLLRDGTRSEMTNVLAAPTENGTREATTSRQQQKRPPRNSSESINSASFSSSSSSVESITPISQRATNDSTETFEALEQFLKAIKLSKTTNILLLSTAFLFTGQLLSFFTGVYGTAIGATSQFGENSKKFIGLAGISIGIGEIFGGIIFGLIGSRGLGDKLRRDLVFLLGYLILLTALSLTFVNLPPDSPLAKQNAQIAAIIEPRLWISLVASAMIGFSDACFNTQVYSLLMSVYNDNSVPAFALFKFTQSIGSAIAFLYSTKLNLYYQIALLATISTIATICFCLAEWRTNPRNNSAKSKIARGIVDNNSLSSSIESSHYPAALIVAAINHCGSLEKSESQQSILKR